MKSINRLTIILLITGLAGSCTILKKIAGPSHVITPLSDTVGLRDGTVVYALPMTVFTVKVEAERTIEIPGPYAKYAEELLGLKGVIRNESEYWSVKGISVSSHEEADPSEYYVIQGSSLLQTNVLALRKEGLILELNPEINYQGKSFVDGKELKLNQFKSSDLGSDEYYQVQTDTAFKRITMDSTFIRIPYIVEKKKKLSEEQLAERSARRLMELREGKIMILTGEANVFPQNDAAINEINRMEKDYTELFTGKTLTETREFVYQFIPQKDNSNKTMILFIFSETTGPEDVSSKNGLPVTIQLVPEQRTKDLAIMTREHSDASVPILDKLYYRIPDVASLKINLGNRTIYSSRKLVSQFGEVMQLPANYIIGK
ncbi:MAG: DUF4831 family protein [Bacteroidales bacterium]|jgi:hypothetical protein|nr:DUF4831 family protein [Bacteroidales bacterium]